jgi:hypothetical protein
METRGARAGKLAVTSGLSYPEELMTSGMDRREALKRVGVTGLVLTGAAALGRATWDQGGLGLTAKQGERQVRDFRLKEGEKEGEGLIQLAISKTGTDPATLTRAAVEALGGMKRFMSRGDVVVVKPNIGWDRTPLHAANTNPEVVAAVVRQMAYEAGAKTVVVTDASCNDPGRCFQRSGIWRAACTRRAPR